MYIIANLYTMVLIIEPLLARRKKSIKITNIPTRMILKHNSLLSELQTKIEIKIRFDNSASYIWKETSFPVFFFFDC